MAPPGDPQPEERRIALALGEMFLEMSGEAAFGAGITTEEAATVVGGALFAHEGPFSSKGYVDSKGNAPAPRVGTDP